jgi:uncharacterized integral membrane protein (TIGR00698 family)
LVLKELSVTASWRAALPGVVLAGALAGAAIVASQALGAFPGSRGGSSPVSPVLCAVVLGLIWRNTIGIRASTEAGLSWITGTLLRVGIALVGLRLTMNGVAAVGLLAIPVVICCIATAFAVSRLVGRWLGLSDCMRDLIAVGAAVCGCTAVIAAGAAIRARASEIGLAVSCVVLFGSIGMLFYPWLANALLGSQTESVGVFLGTSIHDTSQVLGAALIYADQFAAPDVVANAAVTKLLRNTSLLVIVPLLAWQARKQSVSGADTSGLIRSAEVLPAFVVWFAILILVRTAGDFLVAANPSLDAYWQVMTGAAARISELAMIAGMTAVGLGVSFQELRVIGGRPVIAAIIVAGATASCSLALTWALLGP